MDDHEQTVSRLLDLQMHITRGCEFLMATSLGNLFSPIFSVENQPLALVRSLRFYRTFYLALGGWSRDGPDTVLFNHLSPQLITWLKFIRRELRSTDWKMLESRPHGVWYPAEKFSRNIDFWKGKIAEIYPKLSSCKSGSSDNIFREVLDQLIKSLLDDAADILCSVADLDISEKEAVKHAVGRLRFLRIVVRLEESRTERYILAGIQDYARKAAYVFFYCFSGVEKIDATTRNDRLNDLHQMGINGNEPCSPLMIRGVFNSSKRMLHGKGMVLERGNVEDQYMVTTWEYTVDWISLLLDDHYNSHLFECNYCSLRLPLNAQMQSLLECLRFMTPYFMNLSLDVKVLVVQAATSVGLLDVFQFGNLSKDVVKDANFRLRVFVTSLTFVKAELLLMGLMQHNSGFISSVMTQLQELKDELTLLRKFYGYVEDGYTENKVLLLSQNEVLASNAFSLIRLLDHHKDPEIEFDVAFFKLFIKLKSIQSQEHLSPPNTTATHIKDQLLNYCHELRSLLETCENLNDIGGYQNILVDAGGVATKVISLFSSTTLTPENLLKEENKHLYKLIASIKLLEVELKLDTLLNHGVAMTVPFNKIEMLRNGCRLLRLMFMDPNKWVSEDESLMLLRIEAFTSTAMPLAHKLIDNKENEGMTIEMIDLISDVIGKMNSLRKDVTACHPGFQGYSLSVIPTTDRLGFIDFLLENLRDSLSSMPTLSPMKYPIKNILEDLTSTRSLLKDVSGNYNDDDKLNNLVSQLTEAVYEVDYVVGLLGVGDNCTRSKNLWINFLADEIKEIRNKTNDFLANKSDGIGRQDHSKTSPHMLLPVDTPSANKVVVGMKAEADEIMKQITRGPMKLDIVSIVGMGGLGKTTLADKVYNPSVRQSFDIFAWCCVSKVYQKRALLLKLLGCVTEITQGILQWTDDDLSNKLRQLLMKRSYLIVMDDMWDIGAWEALKSCFPEDNNRSRILLTSRVNNIARKAGSGFCPCFLHLLTDEESWELLKIKVFQGKSCPLKLTEVGRKIAARCKGLPLAITVISGLIAKDMNLDWWKEVATNLDTVVSNSIGFSTVIGLSYQYLPDYLRPCFLYFGAFIEGEKINVSKLILLWIAEDLIQRIDGKSLNEAARDCLMELVSRNLVMVGERTSMDGIKTCHVHDRLYELCRAKAEEENFLHVVKDLDKSSSVSNALNHGSDSHVNARVQYPHHRLCIYSEPNIFITSRPSGQCARSLLFFPMRDNSSIFSYDVSFISCNFKLLRTLNLGRINLGDSFPHGFELLIHLRFLAFQGTMEVIPNKISSLRNLETFLVKGLRREVSLPPTIWSMKKLRYLHIKNRFSFCLDLQGLSQLGNLESLSFLSLPYEQTMNVLQRSPRLQKLKCIFSASRNDMRKLGQLRDLNSLTLRYYGRAQQPLLLNYPTTLRKLTLSKFRLQWSEISAIGSLPCLEVLKLLFKAFVGLEWEVKDEEFQTLKYLKLESLDIVRWTASYDSFPCLRRLVLHSCKKLERVPLAFGESSTLQMIQAEWCSKSVAKSVMDIKMDQFETQSRKLEVVIRPPDA